MDLWVIVMVMKVDITLPISPEGLGGNSYLSAENTLGGLNDSRFLQ